MKEYLSEIWKRLQYHATWIPQNTMNLGDIGVMEGKTFIYQDNLKNLKIDFKPSEGIPRMDDAFTYMSHGSVKIETKLAGNAASPGSSLAKGDAGITVEFHRDEAILFKPKGVMIRRIDDQISLGRKIEAMYKQNRWDRNWVVITEVVETYSATIIIAKTKGAKVEVKAKAEISLDELDISNSDAGFSVGTSSGLSTEIIAKEALTPLYRIKGIRGWNRKFDNRGKDEVIPVEGGQKEIFGEFYFEDLA